MCNCAEGVNSGVTGSPNKVTIIEQQGDIAKSWLLAELQSGQTYTKSNWNDSGKNLVVSVCTKKPGVPDYASVIPYVEGDSFALWYVGIQSFVSFRPAFVTMTIVPHCVYIVIHLHRRYHQLHLQSLLHCIQLPIHTFAHVNTSQ